MPSNKPNIFTRVTAELIDYAVELCDNNEKGYIPDSEDICKLNSIVIFNHIDNDKEVLNELNDDAVQNLINQHNKVIYGIE